MSEKTAYQPGEPIWVDLSTPDQAASTAFYGELLGWDCTTPDPSMGSYANFLLRGKKVAGVVPLMAPDQSPTWTVYVCTDDADKTAARVQEAGGAVLVPPMDVMDLGRMAVFADPAGAVFGAWQPGTHVGSELVDEPGTPVWVELTSADPQTAGAFYGTAVGWETKTSEAYVEFVLDDRSVAGLTDPSQGTTGWLPYFSVSDPAATTDRAVALGAQVVLPLTTFPGGSCTIVRDPQGAVFGLMDMGE